METEGPGLIFTLVAFIAGFSFLVFIHEWGHYKMARLFKVRIDTFSIGMGKELWGRTDRNGTRWRISAIPLGGYVKFFGDASAASNPGDIPDGLTEQQKSECFHFKPLWQRSLIVFAGPAINLITAVLIFAGFIYLQGIRVAEPTLTGLVEGAPAEQAGLMVGDTIRTVDASTIERFSDIQEIVIHYPGQTLNFGVLRGGELITIPVTIGRETFQDRFGNEYTRGRIGASTTEVKLVNYGIFGSIAEGTRMGLNMTKRMLTTLGEIIIGLRSVKELGGPVKIAKTIGEAASLGFERFITIVALLSLNLGIVNLLPIPVLDGGHLMFYAAEAIKGSPLSKKAQEAGFIAGAALMLIFMVLVTLNDLQSLAS